VTKTADRCKETSTTTGTGTLTLLGPVAQYQSFQSGFGTSAIIVQYAIVGQSGTEWEVGRGVFTSPSTLTRDNVIASSNSNALVTLSAGTKDVFGTWSSEGVSNSSLGNQLALRLGSAMP
jgi:hypothetical protein